MCSQRSWRVGVLGLGRQALTHRIPSLLALADEGVHLVAVASRNPERARRAVAHLVAAEAREDLRKRGYCMPESLDETGRLALDTYGSLRDMIEATRLDGLLIAVPHSAHADTSVQALEAGLHVLVEKPMATHPADAERMIAAAERAHRVLAVGYPYPYMITWVSQQVARGAIGPIEGARLRWSRQDGIPPDPDFWRIPECGGVSLDLPAHLVTPLLTLLNEQPRSVKATSRRHRGLQLYGEAFAAEDTMEARIVFTKAVEAKLEVSWADGIGPEEELGMTLYGHRGSLEVPLMARAVDAPAFRPVLRTYGGTGASELGPPPPTYPECMVAQARDWVHACQTGRTPRFTARDALRAERVVHAMRRSADVDDWVDLTGT